jgi:hypothetical protein
MGTSPTRRGTATRLRGLGNGSGTAEVRSRSTGESSTLRERYLTGLSLLLPVYLATQSELAIDSRMRASRSTASVPASDAEDVPDGVELR